MGKRKTNVARTDGSVISKTKQDSSGKIVAQASPDSNSKKTKRKFPRKRAKTLHPAENFKKEVANVKKSKEVVSCNWQAFLASDLAKKEIKGTTNLNGVCLRANKRNSTDEKKTKTSFKSNTGLHLISERATTASLDDSLKDKYISEVDPKTDKQKHELTRCIAMDCEMVGVFDGKESVLARVSLVNQHGECVYDHFVKPKEEVADYRTKVSGVRPGDLKRGKEFEVVQKEVAAILEGKILVGHALKNDLKVLLLNHPPKMIRDTSRFKPFRNITNGRTPSLKKLVLELLGVTIQSGEHSSIEDAKASMQLYNLYHKEWEDHRLKKKMLRRKNSIAAAVGNLPLQRKRKGTKEPKSSLLDEFVAF